VPIRSHVDLCLFVRFIHVRPGDLAPEVEGILSEETQQTVESQREAWIKQFSHNLGLSFHEAFHFWQGLRLPFLYRYAQLSLRTINQAFAALCEVPDLHDWNCLLPELTRLTLPSRWHSPAPGRVLVQPLSDGTAEGTDLTPLDLIEGAASLAQWQTTVTRSDERTSWAHFSRWSKRNPTYTKALELVGEALGDRDLAIRAFLGMVFGAFHTSEPVLTLGYLCCRLTRPEASSWIQHSEPVRWGYLCESLLETIEFKGQPDCDGRILGSPYHRLTRRWLETEPPHPMMAIPAKRWLKKEADDDRYKMLLNQPGYVDGDTVAEAMRDFSPFSITRFYLPGGSSRVVITGSGDAEDKDRLWHTFFWLRYLTIYSIVRRAADVNFDPDSRICHHEGCPEYGPNFCNAYPRIPDDFRNCRFLNDVTQIRTEFKQYVKDRG
jgi:hypothetical protein